MKRAQHPLGVERAVMRALRQNLRPSFGEMSDKAYAEFDLDPNAYSSVDQFKRDYSVYAFLRKWKGLETGIDLSRTALDAWLKAEQQCFRTNRRLNIEATMGSYSIAPAAIVAAQRKIASILGRWDIEKIVKLCRFGNGATADLRRGSTHAEKYVKPSVTIDAIPYVIAVMNGDSYMQELVGGFKDLKIIDANRMVMVPKNSKTHRPIAAEPTLNSFVQQGVGRYIRARLKKFGVDLGDQTINQGLASHAQAQGLTTLDLSMASDTLCTSLVKLLLPREWWEVLYDLRSPATKYGKRRFVLSKFSSMGNAFTFELETLIFYALLTAVCEGDVISVYGDDLVVRDSDNGRVREILNWAGFNVNYDKSYTAGSRFFESCGKHYFDGQEVTPCFQKDVCRGLADYVRLHNRLVRAGLRLDLREEFMAAASVVWDAARQRFGRKCPNRGPVVEYDQYFIDPNYEWEPGLHVDRVRLLSVVAVTDLVYPDPGSAADFAYLGRKLRSSQFQNSSRKGWVAESGSQAFRIMRKAHWRSASCGGAAGFDANLDD